MENLIASGWAHSKYKKKLGKGLYYISDDRNIRAALKRVHGTHLKLYYCSSSIADKVKKSIDVLGLYRAAPLETKF